MSDERMTAEKLRAWGQALQFGHGYATAEFGCQLIAWADDIDAVRTAIRDEGPRPKWHRAMMERHRREWPTLWAALDALLAEPS